MTNKFMEKVRNKEKTIGMIINLNEISVSKIIASAGYDFVWLDMEHSHLSLDTVLAHIMIIKSCGTGVIVRVPQDDLTYTKRILEMGIDGIIFPLVKTAEEAKALIENTLYPPYGTRGFGPINAINYGFESAADYVADTENNLLRFVQIEHVDAINNIDSIMENKYIDGYIIGPNDLSGSIGETLQVFEPNTTELIKTVIKKLKDRNKYVGLATGDTSDKTIMHWTGMGIDMLTAGADFALLQQAALNNRINLEKLHKKGL